jgi:uncharacterized protein involved in exopolysaccharide biosynthesis
VELNEAIQRIVVQHLLLITCFVVVGLAVAVGLQHNGHSGYTASARLVIDTPDPRSRTEAESIADTGKAIATSPSQVSAALAQIHVRRDPSKVAAEDISVSSLGTSGVLQLSATDRDPQVAAALANALAAQVIATRLRVTNGSLDRDLATVDAQLERLNRQIADLDSRIGSLGRTARRSAANLRTALDERRAALEAEQVSLLSSSAQRPTASVISPATAPTAANSSQWPAYVALGLILGLVLGVGAAGVMEMFKPTVVGGEAIARELDIPVLGALVSTPSHASPGESRELGERVSAAAAAAGVRRVQLLTAGPRIDLRSFATSLASRPLKSPPAADVGEAAENLSEAASAAGERPPTVEPSDAKMASSNGRGPIGIVVVTPQALKKSDLVATSPSLTFGPGPILGLITYPSAPPLVGEVRRVENHARKMTSSATRRVKDLAAEIVGSAKER